MQTGNWAVIEAFGNLEFDDPVALVKALKPEELRSIAPTTCGTAQCLTYTFNRSEPSGRQHTWNLLLRTQGTSRMVAVNHAVITL